MEEGKQSQLKHDRKYYMLKSCRAGGAELQETIWKGGMTSALSLGRLISSLPWHPFFFPCRVPFLPLRLVVNRSSRSGGLASAQSGAVVLSAVDPPVAFLHPSRLVLVQVVEPTSRSETASRSPSRLARLDSDGVSTVRPS